MKILKGKIFLVSILGLLIFNYCTKENTPPVAVITVNPLIGYSNVLYVFDASESYDNEDVKSTLMYRWDWNNDGVWDTEYTIEEKDNQYFSGNGYFTITMEVIDRFGLSDTTSIEIYNKGKNPTSIMTDPRDGIVYKTVKLSDQWWMAENLKFGVLRNSKTPQYDNLIIEKYAYNNDPENIDKYGGLYQWDEAMDYSTEEGSQGICPPGWHIPSNEEWQNISMNAPGAYLDEYFKEGGESLLNLQYSGIYLLNWCPELIRWIPEYKKEFSGADIMGGYWTSTQFEDYQQALWETLWINYSYFIYFSYKGRYQGFHTGKNGDNLFCTQKEIFLFKLNFAAYLKCVKDIN